jgi:hypothetical protein
MFAAVSWLRSVIPGLVSRMHVVCLLPGGAIKALEVGLQTPLRTELERLTKRTITHISLGNVQELAADSTLAAYSVREYASLFLGGIPQVHRHASALSLPRYPPHAYISKACLSDIPIYVTAGDIRQDPDWQKHPSGTEFT